MVGLDRILWRQQHIGQCQKPGHIRGWGKAEGPIAQFSPADGVAPQSGHVVETQVELVVHELLFRVGCLFAGRVLIRFRVVKLDHLLAKRTTRS